MKLPVQHRCLVFLGRGLFDHFDDLVEVQEEFLSVEVIKGWLELAVAVGSPHVRQGGFVAFDGRLVGGVGLVGFGVQHQLIYITSMSI